VFQQEEEEDMDFNADDFGSRLQGYEEGDDDEEDEDPFDAIFEEEEIIERKRKEEISQSIIGAALAHRGTFVGTPLYASPEMLNDSSSGPFTDVWALGVIVY